MSSPSALFDMAQGRRDLAALPADWQQNIREAHTPPNGTTHNRPDDILIPHQWEVVDQQGLGSLNAREWPFALRAIGFDLARTETYALLVAHGVPPHDHDPSRGPCSPSRLRMPQEHFSAIAAWLLVRRDPQEEAEDAWKMFDPRGTGRITLESLRAVCSEVNSTLSEADMRRMIDMADISGKGWVSKEEFIEVAKGGFGRG
ncbi:centrin-4 [Colletotrichum liriopes]|uniref:Centrin-4 n=1 Tax=Colletotrichum liriopes TaxID=708192 RepID=A0AA37GIF7_9PEZI|nr:centrin-4 [Colletotrichum liriopes]